jgi:hypothetical protein
MMSRTPFTIVDLEKKHASLVDVGGFELLVRGPGIATVRLFAYTGDTESPSSGQPAQIAVEMIPLGADRPVKLAASLTSSNNLKWGGFNAWSFKAETNGIELML